MGSRSAFIVPVRAGNQAHWDPKEGREAPRDRPNTWLLRPLLHCSLCLAHRWSPAWLPRMSASDAVDGSSTGARAPWMWVLLGAYDSEEPDHANHYDYRSRYREVGFSSPWRWCEWRCCCSPSIEAAVCAVVLSEAASVPHWYRGLCVVALLVA